MKPNWMRRLWAAALCILLLAGCSPVSSSPAASSTPAADPLTGLEPEAPGQRPAAVVIDNSPACAAQWGIGSASVVLEAATDLHSSTSLCLVYPSVEAMPTVGPVTRGQDLYWQLLSAQQVLPVQLGCSVFARNFLDHRNLRAVDALEVGRNAFTCGEDWVTHPLWRTSGAAVAQVLPSLGLSASLTADSSAATGAESPATVPPLLPLQTGEDQLPEPDATDAAKAVIHFQTQSSTGFAYDLRTDTYGMLSTHDTPQLDANTGAQAAFDNVLVLFCSSTLREDARSLDYDLTMGGGVWLNGGRLWNITWTLGTDSTLALYDATGQPLALEGGRSYLALLSSVTGQELTVQDSTGQSLPGQ